MSVDHVLPCNCYKHRYDQQDPGWEGRMVKPELAGLEGRVWVGGKRDPDGTVLLIEAATGEVLEEKAVPHLAFTERAVLPVPF